MAKTITLEYEGSKYTLEFTRKTVEIMEKNGFNVRDIRTSPVTTLPTLFAGAFLANHRWLKDETIEKLFKLIPNKDDFLEKLAEMYNEPIASLMQEPDDTAKNVDWAANW